jgi:hypothetical protein
MDRLQVPMPQEIRLFLEELLKEAKIENPDPALKEMMIEDLYQRLQVRITQVLVEHLSAEDFEKYAELAGQDQVKAMEFIKLKNDNIPQYILEATQEFGRAFLA